MVCTALRESGALRTRHPTTLETAGAAGTGHIFGVLPSLALPPLSAASYLVSYLLGAVLAMSGVGCLLGSVGDVGGPRAILYLMGCSSATAICVGLYWIFG